MILLPYLQVKNLIREFIEKDIGYIYIPVIKRKTGAKRREIKDCLDYFVRQGNLKRLFDCRCNSCSHTIFTAESKDKTGEKVECICCEREFIAQDINFYTVYKTF